MRTYTDRHGLKDVCEELLGVDLSKQQQSSDWGAAELTPEQLEYAASDVLHLHELRAKLDAMLEREGRRALAEACFGFLPTRAALDRRVGKSRIFSHIDRRRLGLISPLLRKGLADSGSAVQRDFAGFAASALWSGSLDGSPPRLRAGIDGTG